ncbi:hypothetical protein AB9E29_14970 [Rhizobium leguminosarum]|uniref:hypothetical protein n=1 Tax=Rhizobium leguminosarum TaxID=384 RepID=UPI003F97E81B
MRALCLSLAFLLGLPEYAAAGADVILGELGVPQVYAEHSGIVALSFSTTSCNAGDTPLSWKELPSNEHPIIGLTMYRLLDGRFEQIGQSWLKHGYVALQGNVCRRSQDPDFPHDRCLRNPDGTALGVGCSDPYGALTNEGPNLGARGAVNPVTGFYAGDLSHVYHGHEHPLGIEHGLQVVESDLAQMDEGARYFIEGQYVAPDDSQAGNGHNNVSHREVEARKVNGSWTFGPTSEGTIRRKPAIYAWEDASFSTIDMPETSGGGQPLLGRMVIAQKATRLSGSTHRYEYVVYNMNSERGAASFSVPVGDLVIGNTTFSSPRTPDDAFSSVPWTVTIADGLLTWTMKEAVDDPKANGLRWGSAFTFSFDAAAEPVRGTASLGRLKPGSGPDTVMANIVAPAESPTSIVVPNKDAMIAHLGAELERTKSGAETPFAASGPIVPFVSFGNESEAAAYYARVSQELGFQINGSDLTGLLSFLGYSGLKAEDVEFLDPALLSPTTQDEFDKLANAVSDRAAFTNALQLLDLSNSQLLSARFMAPKIVDVTGKPPYDSGWRKVVRIQARAGSAAKAAGIGSGFILFNYIRPQTDPAPFPTPGSNPDQASKNNQVMLIAEPGAPNLKDSAYWAVYDSKQNGYRSTYFLGAVFDLPDNPQTDGKYYVPRACADCHGHVDGGVVTSGGVQYPNAKLNFLDTDHWEDRGAASDYFHAAATLVGTLFDGGTDKGAPEFARAFERVRTLNAEVLQQNQNADAGLTIPSLQQQGAVKWNELHAQSSAHVPPIGRALGSFKWTAGIQQDEQLLSLLNKYCYRCHSSIEYNIFDKEQVRLRSRQMASYIRGRIMPQGQDILNNEPTDAQLLQELLTFLSKSPSN